MFYTKIMNDNLKILILEDNPTDADLVINELNKSELCYTTEIAQTREEFEISLEKFNPDIILSDYSLPSFDGVTAFHIKQKKHSHIPFIIVSGVIGEENAVELIKNGVTDYALKDKLFTLVPKITRALNDANEKNKKCISDEIMKLQHEKLFEIAFLQSHQVRVPIVHILGLFKLFNFDNFTDPINAEIICKLKITAEEFDKVIQEIVQKTNEIKNIQ